MGARRPEGGTSPSRPIPLSPHPLTLDTAPRFLGSRTDDLDPSCSRLRPAPLRTTLLGATEPVQSGGVGGPASPLSTSRWILLDPGPPVANGATRT